MDAKIRWFNIILNINEIPDWIDFTYIMGFENEIGISPHKIGKSDYVKRRRQQLDSGSPKKLIIVGGFPFNIESLLQNILKDKQVYLEWFKGETLDFIENIPRYIKGENALIKKQDELWLEIEKKIKGEYHN